MANTRVDSGSFEELAMPLLGSLYNFARWLARDTNDAEDLVQEACLKALKGFASFRQGTNFHAWIFKILRNTFLTSRTGIATASLDDEESHLREPAVDDTPESVLLAGATYEAIQSALAALPVPFREVVLLCDVEDMSYQEIADTLSIPIGTVMSRLSRARRLMRQSLSDLKARGACK